MKAPFLLAALLAAALHAQPQQPQPPLRFAAASIKLNTTGHNAMGNKFDPGMARWTNYSLSDLIGYAYRLRDYQTFGWPEWLQADKWNIDATTDGATTGPQKDQMLQPLLEERFHLKFHWEKKEIGGYSLVIAKGGPKLREAQEGDGDSERPGLQCNRASIIGHRMPMPQWIYCLSSALRRPFEDNTGLKGRYTFKLEGEPDPVQPNTGGEPSDPNRGSIFAALPEQLGLKLEPKKFPVDMFVIDHVDKAPTEN